MRVFHWAAGTAALALTLAGCASSGPKIACPNAVIVPELQVQAKFGPGPGRQDTDVTFGAKLVAVDASCSADKKKGGLVVDNKLAVTAIRMKDGVTKGQVTYFEAVVNRKQEILTERDFVIDLAWPRTQRDLTVTDELETFVPLVKDTTGDDYVILFGFRLTPEELQYNREHAPKPPGTS